MEHSKRGVLEAVPDIRAELERYNSLTPEQRERERQAAEARLAEERRREQAIRGREALEEELGAEVPKRYRGRRLADLVPTAGQGPAVAALKDWLLSADDNIAAGRSVWLIGTTGTGKTALLCAALHSLAECSRVSLWRPVEQRPIRIAYINWAEFVARTTISPDRGVVSTIEQKLKGADLLVLDELGGETDTELARALSYSVINYRYTYNRPIWVASNLTPDQLRGITGERQVSRLYEMSPKKYRPLVTGDDLRVKPLSKGEQSNV